MKIGFYFECSTKSGGAYQVALNMLEALKSMPEHEYIVFNISPDFPYHLYKLPNWKIIDLIKTSKKQPEVAVTATENIAPDFSFRRQFNLFTLNVLRALHLYRVEIFLTSLNARRRAKQFDGYGIDLMVYHGPSELSFLTDIPGLVPILDIEHRLHKKEFPELYKKGQWAKREYLYKHIAKKAYHITVDCEISKEDVVREYRVDPRKITVVPYAPPTYLLKNPSEEIISAVRKKFNLPEKFIYYPAQFWPHKNHINLVKALGILKRKGLKVPVVFTGGTQDLWGEYARVKQLIATEDISQNVQFLGFVNADEISVLYKEAVAMVMPVLMGPTFIPVYEAWYMDCPVLYSDIRGPREQAGDAALLLNPYKPEDIAQKIRTVWEDPSLRANLIDRGRAKASAWTVQDFCISISSIVNTFEHDKRSNLSRNKGYKG